jgi:hypothetical protein
MVPIHFSSGSIWFPCICRVALNPRDGYAGGHAPGALRWNAVILRQNAFEVKTSVTANLHPFRFTNDAFVLAGQNSWS